MLRDIRIHTVPSKRDLAKTISDISKRYTGKTKLVLIKPFNSFYLEPMFIAKNLRGYRAMCAWLDKARLCRDLNEHSTPEADNAKIELLVDNVVVKTLDFEWYFHEDDVGKLYQCCLCGTTDESLENMVIHYNIHAMDIVDPIDEEPDNVFNIEDYMN